MIFNNEEAEGGQTIVNIFGKYFSSVYTQPLPNSSFKPNPINTLNSICNLQISLMDVFNELNNINLNLCSGPDNLSSTFLFECRFILSYPLHTLFNQSLITGVFPKSWKSVFISPIFKKGDRSSKAQTDVIYTDFNKAFDRIDHNLLILKLKTFYGINDPLLSWFASFLSERQQIVK